MYKIRELILVIRGFEFEVGSRLTTNILRHSSGLTTVRLSFNKG